MERTKETLEARVRETPLVDRLKECRQRIGKMCSEGRPPRMCIPVQHDDDDFFISTTLSDAQAAVEVLRKQLDHFGDTNKMVLAGDYETLAQRYRQLERQVEALQRERDEAYRQGFADALEKVAREFQDKGFCSTDDIGVVEVQAFLDTRHVHYEECHGVNPLQSELDALQALVRALPVVTGKLEVDSGVCYYVRALDGKENPVVCGLMTEQATAFAIKALLAYRATLDATTPAGGGQE